MEQKYDTDFVELTGDPASWVGQSLVSVTQLTSPDAFELLAETARNMRTLVREGGGGDSRLKHKVLATVFYEASTRTSCSFQTAMMRLGGSVVHVDGQGNSSAAKKEESLDDTLRCLECYVDVVVLRHFLTGSVPTVVAQRQAIAAKIREQQQQQQDADDDTVSDQASPSQVAYVGKPILNAGDGTGEHPTQALLDAFTIWDEFGVAENSNRHPQIVVFLGDLKHGRTVHSLAKLLAQLRPKSPLVLRFCAPAGLEVPQYILEYCSGKFGIRCEQYSDVYQACVGAQVLYVTRVQKERFDKLEDYEKVKGSYVVDAELMQHAPNNMIVLHPLPRVDEISTQVDTDPRAAYFRQMENGMYVRMAILALVLGKADTSEG